MNEDTIQKERLTPNDALWLVQPHSVVCGVYSFQGDLRINEIVGLFDEKVKFFPRFLSRIVPEEGNLPYWETLPSINVREHIYESTIFSGGKAALRQALLDISNAPMDMARPLWDTHLIHLENNKSLFVVRVHHCIADGQGFIHMTNIFSDAPQAIPPYEAQPFPKITWSEKFRSWKSALNVVGRVIFRKMDSLTPIKNEKSFSDFGVDWLDTPFNFAEINRIRSFIHGKRATVNDVLLAILAGGVRHYFMHKGLTEKEINKIKIHCVLPTALPATTRLKGAGNNIGTVQVQLPVNIENPIERLGIIKERMNDVKRSPQGLISMLYSRFAPYLPRWLGKWVYAGLEESSSIFMSNVRGPDAKLTMAGHTLDNFYWFGRPFEKIHLSFPMASYGGKMNIVFLYDKEIIHPESLKYCLMKSYLELLSHHSDKI